MSDFPRWKYALVAVVLLFGIIYALPNAFPQQPAVQVSANNGRTVNDALVTKIRGALQKDHITVGKISTDAQAGTLLARFPNTSVQLQAYDVVKDTLGNNNYSVALNLASTVPSWLRAIHANAMPMGLDLQGGVHFLMEVDQQSVRDQQAQLYTQDLRAVLRQNKIRYRSVSRLSDGVGVRAVLRSANDRDKARNLLYKEYPKLKTETSSKGDDYILTAKLSDNALQDMAQKTIQQNVGTLRNRVNQLGVSEPVIQQQGNDRIVVDLPGIQDTAEAKKILGATATLQYHPGYGTRAQAAEAARTGNVPPEADLYYDEQHQPVLVDKKVIATGDELVDASSGFDQQSGTPDVSVTLNAAGARKMLEYTTANVGKPMAVLYVEHIPQTKIVNGKKVKTVTVKKHVINDATVQSPFGKRFQTTGLGSPKQASELALLLKSGSLASPITIVAQRVIGPSLGQDNIHKGVRAVILGLALVLLCAAIYYKLFGIVADIALFFNLVLLVAVMSMIGVTLTMPGIAGIVLTLGMAIDANVLVCERVREELRNGSTPLASIRAGYEKAWSTILDANVTHLLAALALMTMGSGSIKGFGVTLFIGILTSLFTSVTVTHAITALIHGKRKLKTLSV